MEREELLDLFNELTDRQIVCYLYKSLNAKPEEISRLRNLTISQVYHDSKNIIKVSRHDDIIAALSELFCFSR